MLDIKNLTVEVNNTPILKGLNLTIQAGKVHALMGQNGSGKSTLAQTLMGHPSYTVTSGEAVFLGENILDLEPNVRAQKGLFLSFQYPSEIQGVTISSFLRMIYNKSHTQSLTPVKFRQLLKAKMAVLEMKEDFMHRYLNDGFSGGEKKRMEMLQMLILEPKLAILDETDSGLDIDALRIVSKAVKYLCEQTGMAVLVITHYTRILKYLAPDVVHIMADGQIVREGAADLAHEIEEKGYGTKA